MRRTLWVSALLGSLSLANLMGCEDGTADPEVTGEADAGQDSTPTGSTDSGVPTGRMDAGLGAGTTIDAGTASGPGTLTQSDASSGTTGLGSDAGFSGPSVLPGLDGGVHASPQSRTPLDLLFVIDNSGSMASEQLKLAAQLPRLVRVLTSGDRCAGNEASCTLDDNTQPARRFPAISDLHLGVVSSNAGGIDEPVGTQAAVLSCRGLGDDGKLQNGVDVAVNGVVAGRQEFQDYAQGDVVLSPMPECDLPSLPRYQEYGAGGLDSTELAARFSCVARLGVRGCPFEQQLESMWKALAPSTGVGDNFTFLNGSMGEGDGYNLGFLRADAVLAVLHVSDEEDCSITDDGKVLFAQSQEATDEYGPLNLRCGLRAEDGALVRATTRYVEGLRSLKPGAPERLVFGVIAGIPLDAGDKSIDEVLAMPAMQFREDPLQPGFPSTSCAGMTDGRRDSAYPPRRILEVAKGFAERSVLHSICADTYAPAIDAMVTKIISAL